jgi:curved DNA-binding protein CbpA
MAQVPTVTHYEVLDVPVTADATEIKKAYQKSVRSSHPDVGGSAGLFRLVKEAYEVLSDPRRRAAYDRSLKEDTAGSSGDAPPKQEPPRPEQRQEPPKQERQQAKPEPKPQPKPDPAFRAMEMPPAAPA